KARTSNLVNSGARVRLRPERPAPELHDSPSHQLSNDLLGEQAWLAAAGRDPQFGVFRRLVGLVDAGEIPDLAGERALVQPLGVARNADVERRIDEYLEELALFHEFTHHAPFGLERRDE